MAQTVEERLEDQDRVLRQTLWKQARVLQIAGLAEGRAEWIQKGNADMWKAVRSLPGYVVVEDETRGEKSAAEIGRDGANDRRKRSRVPGSVRERWRKDGLVMLQEFCGTELGEIPEKTFWRRVVKLDLSMMDPDYKVRVIPLKDARELLRTIREERAQ